MLLDSLIHANHMTNSYDKLTSYEPWRLLGPTPYLLVRHPARDKHQHVVRHRLLPAQGVVTGATSENNEGFNLRALCILFFTIKLSLCILFFTIKF